MKSHKLGLQGKITVMLLPALIPMLAIVAMTTHEFNPFIYFIF